VLAQLVEELVHLKGGGERLDEARRAHGAARDAQVRLRGEEDVVPEAALEVGLPGGWAGGRAGGLGLGWG
jgi:hypothetical protein